MAFYDRIKFTISNTPGTGSGFTVDTASSGFRTPATASIPNSTAAVLLITEGTAWEICNSVYTSGSTSWSRGSLVASSTGSAVNFTSAAVVGIIVAAHQLVDKTGDTMTGKLTTLATVSGGAGLTLPHGTAPSAPVDGDLWTTSAGGLYAQINGVTVGPMGAMTLAAAATVLSNTATASFSIDATKKGHIFVLDQVVPATDSVNLLVLASTDGGSNYNVSLSSTIFQGQTSVVDAQQAGVTTGVSLQTTAIGSDTNEYGWSGVLHFRQAASKYGFVTLGQGQFTGDTAQIHTMIGGSIQITTTSAVTHLRFQQSSGNMESGRIAHYHLN